MFSHEDLEARNASLQVPNQSQIPMGSENDMTFFMKDRFITLPDGTVMDLETRKQVKGTRNDPGCWGSRIVDWGKNKDPEPQWGDPMDCVGRRSGDGLTRDDVEYANISKMMNKRTVDSMSDEQKNLLANLDSILGPSKLVIEEGMNGRNS